MSERDKLPDICLDFLKFVLFKIKAGKENYRFCHYSFQKHRCVNESPCNRNHECACGEKHLEPHTLSRRD